MIEEKSVLLKDDISHSAIITSTEVTNSNGGKEYVEYNIKITVLYYTWVIKRRFSDFFKLNEVLMVDIPDLPPLPSKRLFFNLSQSVIQQRIELFDMYLSFIMKEINFFKYQEIIDFLEIGDHILEQLLSGNYSSRKPVIELSEESSVNTKKSNAMTGITTSNVTNYQINEVMEVNSPKQEFKNYYSTLYSSSRWKKRFRHSRFYQFDEFIEQFLFDLSEQCENSTEIIKVFYVFIQENDRWSHLHTGDITLLLIGDIERNIKGIFYYIGLINRNYLGAQSCLRFFCKLINYELNPDCEKFISIFKSLPIELIGQMNLHKHIKTNNPSILIDCLHILRVYFDNQIPQKSFEYLIKDELIYEEYINMIEV